MKHRPSKPPVVDPDAKPLPRDLLNQIKRIVAAGYNNVTLPELLSAIEIAGTECKHPDWLADLEALNALGE
jgi:hypothetical protein